MLHLDMIKSKHGYLVGCLISFLFVASSVGMALFLESIVNILGLVEAIMAPLYYFGLPVWFIVVAPRLKKENGHVDLKQSVKFKDLLI